MELTVEVDGDDRVPLLLGHVEDHPVAQDPCDVNHDVDAPIGELRFLSDGAWMWPSDLIHYLELYDVNLPNDFVAHMASNDWRPTGRPWLSGSAGRVPY